MNSPLFGMIKRYYDLGLYNTDPSDTRKFLGNFVKANMITADEYNEISGEEYTVE